MASPASPPVFPVVTEDLFIPDAIEFNLENNPSQPFFTFADASAPDGVGIITHLEFGRAAHRIAHAVRPNRSGSDGQVVAIIALADVVLYQAIIAGLIVAGFVPFPISPRNTPAAILNLLEKSSCRRLITTSATLKPLVDGLKSCIANTPLFEDLLIQDIPSFTTAYPQLARETAEHPFERYPGPSQRPRKDDLYLYLHSSGSTGFPKAIPQTHLVCTQWASLPAVADFRDHIPRVTIGCMALPPFHTLGVYMQLMNPLYGIVPISVFPPTATSSELLPATPSPQNILEHVKLTKSNALMIIPTLLQLWHNSSAAVELLKSLEFVIFAGGPLAPKLGESFVNSGVRLHSIYGGTEFGSPCRLPLKEDEKEWEYMHFTERVKIRWNPQSDGTSEMQILNTDTHRPMVNNLPDVLGYATSDLWENHPTKKHLWKIVGRLDDVIIHSSGEKTVPGPMENIVMSSPLVHGAIMFGRQRDQTGILIELAPGYEFDVDDQAQVAALRNKLWPTVEEANSAGPAFSRIFKEMILLAPKDKPLPRAGKGTVMRKAALALYDAEIDALYGTVESSTKGAEDVLAPVSWSSKDVEEWLIKQAVDLTSRNDIAPSADLFEQGFDSLSATFLRLRITGALRSSGEAALQKAAQTLTQNLVYSYPVISQLATHIASLCTSCGNSSHAVSPPPRALIEELIKKYSAGFESSSENTLCPRASLATVLLTGSTGNLGSEILVKLLEDDRVDKVYAFNRPSKPASLAIRERHLERFKDKGFDPALLDSEKLVFLSGDAAEPDLGLDRGQYSQLCRSVNVVIHNAWRLDFNLSLSSFESSIQGTRHLVDLLKSGPNASSARFVFTSSVASAQSWDKSRGPFPEEVITDASVAVGGGYGEAKYVAERVLSKSGLQVTSLRIGQISGGRPKGAWATTDWLPILVKSSVTLGRLPTLNGVISWLPMDAVASAIVHVAVSDVHPPQALNLVHPRPIEWQEMISNIQATITEVLGRDLKLVSFAEWLSAVEAHGQKAAVETFDTMPAIKLLDFFRSFAQAEDTTKNCDMTRVEAGGLATFSTEKMQRISDLISQLPQIGREDARLWVNYWREVNFLV
ncbi:putative acetyl-CoA synthetase-like protein [Lyophyllum shimeji]|uniref:Acetyl-CoA synthetase-like protein n=1 Tax=Lyophyllum shimeji TaxID=47721 RepID=A0A9P3PCC1_LYOSH|nr:putative acetyl-CoA synthetase-like protein [Lyophyllum shimeji]